MCWRRLGPEFETVSWAISGCCLYQILFSDIFFFEKVYRTDCFGVNPLSANGLLDFKRCEALLKNIEACVGPWWIHGWVARSIAWPDSDLITWGKNLAQITKSSLGPYGVLHSLKNPMKKRDLFKSYYTGSKCSQRAWYMYGTYISHSEWWNTNWLVNKLNLVGELLA